MGQKVTLGIKVVNEDNSAFMDGEINYSNVSPAGVVLIEDKFLGVLVALQDVAKENLA
jgi:hypothetical protein